jgi:hypothetical protein
MQINIEKILKIFDSLRDKKTLNDALKQEKVTFYLFYKTLYLNPNLLEEFKQLKQTVKEIKLQQQKKNRDREAYALNELKKRHLSEFLAIKNGK